MIERAEDAQRLGPGGRAGDPGLRRPDPGSDDGAPEGGRRSAGTERGVERGQHRGHRDQPEDLEHEPGEQDHGHRALLHAQDPGVDTGHRPTLQRAYFLSLSARRAPSESLSVGRYGCYLAASQGTTGRWNRNPDRGRCSRPWTSGCSVRPRCCAATSATSPGNGSRTAAGGCSRSAWSSRPRAVPLLALAGWEPGTARLAEPLGPRGHAGVPARADPRRGARRRAHRPARRRGALAAHAVPAERDPGHLRRRRRARHRQGRGHQDAQPLPRVQDLPRHDGRHAASSDPLRRAARHRQDLHGEGDGA